MSSVSYVGTARLNSSYSSLFFGSRAACGHALSWYCKHATTRPVFDNASLLKTAAIVDDYASETDAESYDGY